MNILVVGGSGNVGSYVVASLCRQGVPVVVLDKTEPSGPLLQALKGHFDWIKADIADYDQVREAFKKHKPRRVIHTAAMLAHGIRADPQGGMRVNINGTINVLEASKENGVERVIFASTDAVSGDECLVRHESAALGPTLSTYAASKLVGERLGALYSELHGIGFIALRYSLTFGPVTIASPGIAKAFERIQEVVHGRDITISEFAGSWRQQITYVADTAEATVCAALHPSPSFQVYNVAGPYDNFITMNEFYLTLKSIVPTAGQAHFCGPHRASGLCDISRLRDDLGFTPRHSVADGIRARLEQLNYRRDLMGNEIIEHRPS